MGFMAANIPVEIRGQRYISLATFRKNGAVVHTPVWFAEEGGSLYVMTSDTTGKYKRIRNNSQVRIAPCTIRGKITGSEFPATAKILPQSDGPRARGLIRAKYWLARLPLIWSKTNAYIEITL
jgi:PPOX class probable F420-dependent enzyme